MRRKVRREEKRVMYLSLLSVFIEKILNLAASSFGIYFFVNIFCDNFGDINTKLRCCWAKCHEVLCLNNVDLYKSK